MSRALSVVSATAVVLAVGGWTTGRNAIAPPPSCTQQQTQRHVVLATGTPSTGGDGYERFCGRGVVMITATASGRSMTIRGGQCWKGAGSRRFAFGLMTNGRLSRDLGRGVSLVLDPGRRGGRVEVIDGRLQPLGSEVGLTGSARVASDFRSGSFSVVTRGLEPQPNKHYTGHWNCG